MKTNVNFDKAQRAVIEANDEYNLVLAPPGCGKTEILTPEEAFNKGWDYPTRMGGFGIVGPRTCGDSPIYLTVWWALVVEKKRVSELSQQQKETIKRIQGEPESIIPEED